MVTSIFARGNRNEASRCGQRIVCYYYRRRRPKGPGTWRAPSAGVSFPRERAAAPSATTSSRSGAESVEDRWIWEPRNVPSAGLPWIDRAGLRWIRIVSRYRVNAADNQGIRQVSGLSEGALLCTRKSISLPVEGLYHRGIPAGPSHVRQHMKGLYPPRATSIAGGVSTWMSRMR